MALLGAALSRAVVLSEDSSKPPFMHCGRDWSQSRRFRMRVGVIGAGHIMLIYHSYASLVRITFYIKVYVVSYSHLVSFSDGSVWSGRLMQ